MVEVYADDGISGTNTAKREGFNRMIEDCKSGKIDMILTKSISRFSRNTVDCLKYTRELKDMNIAVFFEKENINTLDAKGEVLMTIMAALAQQESESLSANVRLGIQFRNQQGKVQINHNWFLGYTKDEDGKLVINPEEVAVVQRTYAEYMEGRSFLHIKRGLEADTDQKIAEVDAAVNQKQAELLDAGRDQEKIDEIGDAIMQLREERQQILTLAALRKDVKDRIEDLASFLDEQTQAVTEYSDVLVRRLIERITVYDEMLMVEFKSGLEIEVDA